MTLKKLFAGLISLAAALFAVCAISVCAGAETSGDYKYSILDDGTVRINRYTGNAKELIIPSTLEGKSVTIIGESAFVNCTSLTSINIPDSVTSIDDSAFYGCSSLTSITVDDNNEYYSSQDGILFDKDMTALLSCPCGRAGEFIIPDGVTSIGDAAFRNCSSLTSVNIPDGVMSICDYAFSGCSSLTSIIIPDGVTDIGLDAFRDCSSLISINIPESVVIIGRSPSSLPWTRTFDGCTSLTSINVDKNNMVYSSHDGVIFNKDMTEIMLCPRGLKGEYIIPDGVTSIGYCAFENCLGLTSVDIPDGVTSIGASAFRNCSSLTSITIPDSVTSIGGSAFEGCSSITSIDIPDGVTSIEYLAFYGCSSLKSINIPDSVTRIGSDFAGGAFSGCSSLISINIPSKVTTIYSGTFSGCSSLTSITIPDGVTVIDERAFWSCSNLTSINIPDSVTRIERKAFSGTPILDNQTTTVKYVGKWAVDCDKDATTATIKSGTVGIADWAFDDCLSLISVTIPDSVTSIGKDAFSDTPFLKNQTGTVKYAGKWVIDCDRDATTVTIKSGTVGIADNAFYFYYSSLTTINIPDGVTSIGRYAFYNCSSLKSINIPNRVTSIGDWAFYNCSSLTSITIPNGVTRIGDGTFSGCSSLTSITIPNGVTNIGNSAFSGCSSLTSINVDKNNKYYSSLDGVLFNKDKTTLISCPDNKNGKYVIPDSVTNIGNSAFDGCSSLTTINIPDGVTSIGHYAFYDCSSLKSINIPNSVTSIGDWAFCNCSSLTSITIPNGVTRIGDVTFSGCSSLTSITIPNGVTNIGNSAFSGCSSLTSITIPDSVTSIGNNAFDYRCENLKDVYYIGSKSQWDKIAIGTVNENLLNANIHYLNLGISGLKLKGRAADALRLSWTKNTSADGYIIEMKSGNSWVRVGKITSNSTVEFRKDKLKAGTAYTFRVKAYKMDGKTALYSGYTSISARTNPSAVTGLKLKGRAGDALRISWAKNTSADGYIIEMKSGTKWVRIGKITKNSTVEFRKSGLKAGTAYSFRVKAYKMSGKTALYGATKTISVRTNPSAVSGLKLKASAKNAVRLSWTKNTSADGYIIEMKNGSTWTRVGKITKNSTVEFKKSKLKAGTAYTFRVKAYKMSGKTALYGATKTISVRTNPSAVSGLKLKASAKNAVRLSWTKNTSADGYIIEMKSGNSWTRVGKITSNSTVEFRKDKLKAGTAYTFRVKAYKMSGKTALYGATKTISVRTNPSAVSGLKLKASAKDAVRLSWTKNTSADGYIIEMKVNGVWKRASKITSNSTVEFKKSGLKSKTSYTFRVKTYKMSGKTALYGATKTITVKTK